MQELETYEDAIITSETYKNMIEKIHEAKKLFEY